MKVVGAARRRKCRAPPGLTLMDPLPPSRGRVGIILEAWMREPVRAHLEAQGCRVRHEVPLHGRVADILARRGDEVLAVELKLEDWREALRQAMHDQLAAHRSYIAMPLHNAVLPLPERSRLERQGVGLLAVHPLGEVRTLLEARESRRRLPFLTQHALATWFPPACAHAAGPLSEPSA